MFGRAERIYDKELFTTGRLQYDDKSRKLLCIIKALQQRNGYRQLKESKMGERNLYLECAAGVSGDMLVAALIDLGADMQVLQKVLASIPVQGFRTEITRVQKAGLDCCDFNVILDAVHENHDHDMEYLQGEETEHHVHTHESHEHSHTGLREIKEIIARTDMTENARSIALRIFDILADAEAKAHGTTKDEVHFHEVGAVDSIVDIISIAVCADNLGAGEVIVPQLSEGMGTIRCQHGILPVPVPAVAEIAAVYGMRMKIMNIQGEFVTPTGAAAVAALRTSEKLPASFIIEKTGMGAGKRNYEIPGILRAMLISLPDEQQDRICKLESNIDDCTGEELGYVMEKLFESGARDVHYTPVYMKKNRPAWQLNVICDIKDIAKLEQIIFTQTTTIGIRRVMMERSVLTRSEITVQTEYGEARVKACDLEGSRRFYPEYDSVTKICQKSGMGYPQVYALIQHLAAGEQS